MRFRPEIIIVIAVIGYAGWKVCAQELGTSQAGPTLVFLEQADKSDDIPVLATTEKSDVNIKAQVHDLTGLFSCTGSMCHGNSTPDRGSFALNTDVIRRDEFQFFLERKDPHSKAAKVLDNELSQNILKNLGIDRSNEAQMRRCYVCHTTEYSFGDGKNKVAKASTPVGRSPTYRETLAELDTLRAGLPVEATPEKKISTEHGIDLSFGVSCEACHGTAEHWLSKHYSKAWKQDTNAETKASLGFVNQRNILTRVQNCVKCHVGDTGRDVDHDLIGAGHPALRFEFASYMAMYPKHWNDKRESNRTQGLSSRYWIAGQLASAEAALKLLVGRTDKVDHRGADGVWPEFSELNCYACHHDIGLGETWRTDRGYLNSESQGLTKESLASPRVLAAWNTWYFPMLESIAANEKMPTALQHAGFSDAVAKLRKHMQSGWVPLRYSDDDVPNANKLAQEALKQLQDWMSSEELNKWLNVDTLSRSEKAFDAEIISQATSALKDHSDKSLVQWDKAVQLYLFLYANNPPKDSAERLVEIRKILQFTKGENGPSNFKGNLSEMATPDSSNRAKLKKLISEQFSEAIGK